MEAWQDLAPFDDPGEDGEEPGVLKCPEYEEPRRGDRTLPDFVMISPQIQ